MRVGTNPATELLGEHGYRLLAAETATAAGHALRRDGRISRARRSTERAAALRAGCQGARTPLLDLDGLGTVLTPRERQVAISPPTCPAASSSPGSASPAPSTAISSTSTRSSLSPAGPS
ncbi:hypothetical protein [Micromonospora sp. CPCC 206061]|uniref:hypothetical protein n=1 Tax=Micromonospora sp. CPCC 206061 TaxID=3122410 RepID=UPI002FF31FC7